MAGEVAVPRVGGKSRRRFDPKIIVGGIVILLAVAYLIVAALPSGTAYYITVSELQEMGARAQEQRTRVSGNVVPGTIVRSAASQDVRFQVEDESGRLTVVYTGVVPDIFGDEAQVVVEGTQGANGVYRAHTLLAKCPSRFEEAPAAGGKNLQAAGVAPARTGERN